MKYYRDLINIRECYSRIKKKKAKRKKRKEKSTSIKKKKKKKSWLCFLPKPCLHAEYIVLLTNLLLNLEEEY
jgi:hypothetical protein